MRRVPLRGGTTARSRARHQRDYGPRALRAEAARICAMLDEHEHEHR
ncbi:MAG: hypothetical protein Q8R92_03480 [Deltaproteobacteria bacterium]|nr:hypothetical protein [Deltaproteobacteria bacterium]